MPVIDNPSYKAPFLLQNCHLQTVLPTLFRRVKGVNYSRERINTPDGDFIDLDFSAVGADRAVILSHGLEGKSGRAYMKGMIKAFNKRGWDGAAFNFRGCSGEPNITPATYHSGKTEDLDTVVKHLVEVKKYKIISLIGFSLGANLTLKYAGESGKNIPRQVRSAVAISAPCDLVSSSIEIHKRKNLVYSKRFLSTLVEKMKMKEHLHSPYITRDYRSIKTLKDFDDQFTAPLNGYKDAIDYWKKCSSINFLGGIAIPVLILNAKDDPILGKECYPFKESSENRNLYLEVPEHGGHMGFITFCKDGEFWHETRAADFIESHSGV